MAKSIFIDGVWVVMHFNSSPESYFLARDVGHNYIECCHCHNALPFDMPAVIGKSQIQQCQHCKKEIEYKTIFLAEDLTKLFDVRGGDGSLAIGSVMHVGLPARHPEFDNLINYVQNSSDQKLPGELYPPEMEFISLVINNVSQRFLANVSSLVECKKKIPNNMYILSSGFNEYGKVLYPRLGNAHKINIPPQEVETAANELEQYLLGKYCQEYNKEQKDDVDKNLLSLCLTFLQQKYSSRSRNINSSNGQSLGISPQGVIRQSHKSNQYADEIPDGILRQGDTIGEKYVAIKFLGRGGFGVVYEVYSHELKMVLALKTFRDEYLRDAKIRQLFHNEASIWVNLGRHPCIVRAYLVDEINDRLYIAMGYIAPDEHGLNSLEGYLKSRPPDLAQALRWAIQFCHGMEYAYSKGVRAHRDIKPANIMISQDKTVKITDFGLASILDTGGAISGGEPSIKPGRIGLSGQAEGNWCGTFTHMSPEQFTHARECDERSDIYSFGIVLYQMVAGGRFPFLAPAPRDDSEEEMARFWKVMKKLQSESPVTRLDSPLFPIIQRCLEKQPDKRFQSFQELRSDLEPLLKRQTGEIIRVSELKDMYQWDTMENFNEAIISKFPEMAKGLGLSNQQDMWEWGNKGISLDNLGRYEEAIGCYDKVLEIDPRNAKAWNNKGCSLINLDQLEDAIRCFDKALEIDPHEVNAWNNKGVSLHSLGRYEEAILCLDKALELDPCKINTWETKGKSLSCLSRYEEAIRCYDQALELDPRYVNTWVFKGLSLNILNRREEAIRCYNKALELDPRNVVSWGKKSLSLYELGRYEESIHCFEKALELDPRDASVWYYKGISLGRLGRYEEAVRCLDKTLELDPSDANAWHDKGICLGRLGHYEESILCFDKALELDPCNATVWHDKGGSLGGQCLYEEAICCYDKVLQIDPLEISTWFMKAFSEDELGHWREAARSYQQFLALAPVQYAEQIEYARKRLRELGGK